MGDIMSSQHNPITPEPKNESDDEYFYGRYRIIADSSQFYDKPIEELNFSLNVINSLKPAGITTFGDVLDMLAAPAYAMITPRYFAEGVLDEIITKLKEQGYFE
jgi:DNA-directed RNA polymerase alpha subunit